MLHLTFPDISHKSRYLDMIEEWRNFEEVPTSPANLFMWESYEDFIRLVESKHFFWPESIPSDLLFFMDDDEILGAIDIRHGIDHPALSIDGWAAWHIGYGLRPSARGRWLAKEMLALWLEEARKLSLSEVVISAFEDNPPSWKTIEKCGWKFLKTKEKDRKPLKIYTIQL